jgi:cellulose synthase operon protein C
MTMTNSRWRRALGAAALVSACALAACSGDTPEKLIASAKTSLAKGDTRAAAIDLKTALQKKPDAPEVRFLLGRALLEGEEPTLAIVELRKALELRHPREEVIPMLAQAMLQRGQFREVISEFGLLALGDKVGVARLKTALGSAHLALGQAAQAEAAYQQALEADPGHVPAVVARARLAAMQGNREAAEQAIDGLIAAGSADAQAWLLKGDLMAARATDVDAALAAYRKALGLSANLTAAHAGIITLHLYKRDMKAASEQVVQLQKARPGQLIGRYFQAQVAHESGDYNAAREVVQDLLKRRPDHPQYNQLAGAVELALGSHEAARTHLTKAINANPGNLVARRLLATAHVRVGEGDKALALLEPLLNRTPPDAVALALAGEAYLASGSLDKSAQMFVKAVEADPSPVNQAALARSKLLKGDAEAAIAELQQIAAADKGYVADFQLVAAQMGRRDYKATLAALDGLERKMGKKALPSHLRGLTYLGLKDVAQARASFERAVAVDGAYFPSVAALAALDVEDKKLPAAQARLEAVLKAQPGHLNALLTLANLRVQAGAPKAEVSDLLNKAVRANPSQDKAHLALINYLLRSKDFDSALSAAQRADAAMPAHPSVLDALGRAQVAAGQANQAITTFSRLAALRPTDPVVQMRVADANLAARDTAGAIQSLQRAVALGPDSPALFRLFTLQLQSGKTQEALALARNVQKRHPGHSVGFVLEGDAQRVLKNNDAALAAYRRGTTKSLPAAAAIKLHGLLARTGKEGEAKQFSQTWSGANPNDVMFAYYLGEFAFGNRDFAAAEAAYRRVLELQADHVPALNNLAWILVQEGKPGALDLSQKANSLRPNQPALIDTLALALAADKQIDKAIDAQKRAIELAPDNPGLRLGLARLHVQAGQKGQARALLEPLERLGDNFRDHAEVKRLLAAL